VKNYPATVMLAQFPVLSDSTDVLTFDFNVGMSQLFNQGDWYSSDFTDPSADPTSLTAVKVQASYIASAQLTANTLAIRQTAQAQLNGPSGGVAVMPVQVAYYIKPYIPNENFTPTKAPNDLERMGFFEVHPQFNADSGEDVFATKVDISKPVVYAISANTPDDFKQAVRDGILYWNKALGKDVIQVIDAPEGVYAPDANYNMVQWVDWDSAGFAYADAQMDPRTGEILHQQVYFTSGWAHYGEVVMQQYLRSLAGQNNEPAKIRRLGLNGFKPQRLCDL
jgi:hypothetical protein